MNGQFSILSAIHRGFLHNQLPELILLRDGQHWVAFQNVLCGWNDLRGSFFLMIVIALLLQKFCFGALKLADFLGQGSISFGEHIDGIRGIAPKRVRCLSFMLIMNRIDITILKEYSSRDFLIPKSIDIEKVRMYT